jgi:hypothetical protein
MVGFECVPNDIKETGAGALNLLFQHHGVPRSLTVDEEPEMMAGDFNK